MRENSEREARVAQENLRRQTTYSRDLENRINTLVTRYAQQQAEMEQNLQAILEGQQANGQPQARPAAAAHAVPVFEGAQAPNRTPVDALTFWMRKWLEQSWENQQERICITCHEPITTPSFYLFACQKHWACGNACLPLLRLHGRDQVCPLCYVPGPGSVIELEAPNPRAAGADQGQ